MPTGYTAGILDGSITTFEEYAKQCMRAFGATVHMRDEPFDKEWEPLEPSNYHKKRIKECEEQLEFFHSMDAEEFVEREKERLLDSFIENCDALIDRIEKKNKLDAIKEEAELWEPPTSEHNKFKKFMIEQIDKTIDFDCNYDMWMDWLRSDFKKFNNIDGDDIKKSMIEKLESDIEYHTKNYHKDLKNANDKNQWVMDVLSSLGD